MLLRLFPAAALVALLILSFAAAKCRAADRAESKNIYDVAKSDTFKNRAADWRSGAIVYQVFVDRFAPPENLAAKRSLYGTHAILKKWNELPRAGKKVEGTNVWSHEVEFWGGDLAGLRKKLEYIRGLGADAIYLNPIFYSMTNHKYDAWDFNRVDPAYGTRAELADLTRDAHRIGMKVILDGVFNHMGSGSPFFKEAIGDPRSRWRNFFRFDGRSKSGYVGWCDVGNLPELNLENPAVQKYIFDGRGSVVQSYIMKEDIDGWRLDVAYDLGFNLLKKITDASHAAKKDSVVIGEIWNYPQEWFPSVDGVMNMHMRSIVLKMLERNISPDVASQMVERMVEDSGIENILRSWIVIDNHDVPRLSHLIADARLRRVARALQFTLPGSPCIYYGSEAGMEGGGDPAQRAPMRWDLARDENPEFRYFHELVRIRKTEPALRYGDFVRLVAEGAFAFMRKTDRASETIVVIVNPGPKAVETSVQLRNSKMQDVTVMLDMLSGASFKVFAGFIDAKVPARSVMILKPDTSASKEGYDRYDRVY